MLDPFSAIYRILRNTEKIMTAQDDMTAAVAGLTTAVSAENSQVDALVSQLAAGAKASGMDGPTVEGIVSQLNGLTASINSKLAQFSAPSGAAGVAGSTGPAGGTGTTGATGATGDAPTT